jgi:TetR/AcrR family transcriptional regulator, cholesterol catabolism regulator
VPRPSRRAEVRATAARLIREHGYASATMDLLAEQVGLNKGTLYHYYPSKSAILHELLSDQIDATIELVARVPATGSATERMRALVRLQVERVSTRQDEILVFLQETPWIDRHLPKAQVAELRRRIGRYEGFTRELLVSGIDSGEFRKLDPNMIIFSIAGILSYVPGWFRQTNQPGRHALVQELTEFVMRGVLA